MEKTKLIKVVNRDCGTVCYTIPEMGIKRAYAPREQKEVTFGELQALSYQPGGDVLLSDFLVIKDKDAAAELLGRVEPEYYYTADEIRHLLEYGSLDQLLDCLDFAPEGVLDLVKDIAVDLPLNDITKRRAIRDKLGFDVTRAIEIKNTKFDGEENDPNNRKLYSTTGNTKTRRVLPPEPPSYKIISTSK